LICGFLSSLLLSSGVVYAQKVTNPTNEHPNPYRTINGYFGLPDDRPWGASSAVDIDIDGESIWVAERCGTNSCATSVVDSIIKYDADGNIITSFGGGMIIWPHGIHVDRHGNVWVTDARAATADEISQHPAAAGKGHVVHKFSQEGELLLTLGSPGVLGMEQDPY
jgi:hypothetical protein